ncbi:hypothetical protein [Cryptosporangium sp. NPDC051539]|uniref:hypothetical protein n=1 Tax=Cryptosporangium sp. NPDC051539 TaxID=3363962 RepID=UPI0037A4C7ED
MNLKARLIPREHRRNYQAVCIASDALAAANRRLAAAKTPKAKTAAQEAVIAASNRHHRAMGRLPLWVQAIAKDS